MALLAYLLILAVGVLVYRSHRATQIKRLRAELAGISAEQNRARAMESEAARLVRLFPADAGAPAFIEALYRNARESGLKQHEVATEAGGSSGTARPGGPDASRIARHRFKVSATGGYRNFAEYIRRLQNIERINRITDFRLTPDNASLKGTLTVELYSLAEKQ